MLHGQASPALLRWQLQPYGGSLPDDLVQEVSSLQQQPQPVPSSRRLQKAPSFLATLTSKSSWVVPHNQRPVEGPDMPGLQALQASMSRCGYPEANQRNSLHALAWCCAFSLDQVAMLTAVDLPGQSWVHYFRASNMSAI